jgi:hypothetical protein
VRWKLAGYPQILEGMMTLGVGRDVRLPGVMELAFATLLVIPAPFTLGLLPAPCYFAGAIATALSPDALKVNGFIPIVLLWSGASIRDRSIFFAETPCPHRERPDPGRCRGDNRSPMRRHTRELWRVR